MKHTVRRLINGTYYICTDIGCPNWGRAEKNRHIVREKLFLSGYLKIEDAVAHTPLNQPLPSWIPFGEVLLASGGERHEVGGGRSSDNWDGGVDDMVEVVES